MRNPDNPDWEIGRPNWELVRTPQVYEGKAVKSLRIGPEKMRPWPGGYKLLFMRRNAVEQQESYFKRFRQLKSLQIIVSQVELSLDLAYNRSDTEVYELDYAVVVEEPLRSMQELSRFLDFPNWDAEAAAAVVDPEMKHWRIEELPGVSMLGVEDMGQEITKLRAEATTVG